MGFTYVDRWEGGVLFTNLYSEQPWDITTTNYQATWNEAYGFWPLANWTYAITNDADTLTETYSINSVAKPTPTARDLCFGHIQSPEGRYYHDYRDRNQGVDYEYVELKNPVDLRQVKAYVNFYKGATANPSGLVVLHYGGRTYQGSFTLRAPSGNQAAARDQRAQSPHWVEIDLMQLLQAAAATPNRPAPGDNTIQGGQGIP